MNGVLPLFKSPLECLLAQMPNIAGIEVGLCLVPANANNKTETSPTQTKGGNSKGIQIKGGNSTENQNKGGHSPENKTKGAYSTETKTTRVNLIIT